MFDASNNNLIDVYINDMKKLKVLNLMNFNYPDYIFVDKYKLTNLPIL